MREFGSEFPGVSLPDAYFDKITQIYKGAVYLRSGREALGYVSENIIIKKQVILLPAYCCESMISPFSNRGWTIYYYSLNEDLTINTFSLEDLLQRYSPVAVLVMNYFGFAPTDIAIGKIKSINSEIVVIEDFTHSLFNFEYIYNPQVDYYVASIRKWFGINDGALVLSNRSLSFKPSYCSNVFVELRSKALEEKLYYLIDQNAETKISYRKKLLEAEEYLKNLTSINAISEHSLKVIHNCCSKDIIRCRKKNAKHLYDNIKYSQQLIFPRNIEFSLLGCPFSLPILVDNRAEIQQRLAMKGLYASVLWPINNKAQKVCKYSSEMSDKMLSIPIDQRYDYDDVETISAIILSTLDTL